MLQLFTTVGSTLFHLTRETKFFNLDNVFATSLLITTLWGFFLAIHHGESNYRTAVNNEATHTPEVAIEAALNAATPNRLKLLGENRWVSFSSFHGLLYLLYLLYLLSRKGVVLHERFAVCIAVFDCCT